MNVQNAGKSICSELKKCKTTVFHQACSKILPVVLLRPYELFDLFTETSCIWPHLSFTQAMVQAQIFAEYLGLDAAFDGHEKTQPKIHKLSRSRLHA